MFYWVICFFANNSSYTHTYIHNIYILYIYMHIWFTLIYIHSCTISKSICAIHKPIHTILSLGQSCPSKCLRDPDNPLIERRLDAVVYSPHLSSRYEDVYSFKPAGARANMLTQTGNRKRSSGRRDRNYSGPARTREGFWDTEWAIGPRKLLFVCVCVCMGDRNHCSSFIRFHVYVYLSVCVWI